MPSFSNRSLVHLSTCHGQLKGLFVEVVKHFDCTILEGYRDREKQDFAFRSGRSQLRFPASKHNRWPSLAVDVAPYPIDWRDRERFTMFAGFVLGVASQMGVRVRWGGDWDRDTEVADNVFDDLPHFELVDEEDP